MELSPSGPFEHIVRPMNPPNEAKWLRRTDGWRTGAALDRSIDRDGAANDTSRERSEPSQARSRRKPQWPVAENLGLREATYPREGRQTELVSSRTAQGGPTTRLRTVCTGPANSTAGEPPNERCPAPMIGRRRKHQALPRPHNLQQPTPGSNAVLNGRCATKHQETLNSLPAVRLNT
jgi:hypothetical protein